MSGLGLVLLILGFVLSNIDLGSGDSHGGDHKLHEEHEGAKSDDHSDASTGDDVVHYASNQDAGHHEEGAHGHGEEHGDAAHGDAHGDAAHGEDHAHGHDISGHKENGTWRRAVVHPEQVIATHHTKEITAGSKFGASLLGGTFYWFIIALFGVFFIAVGYLANAGWYVYFKRVLENYYRFLPIAGVVLIATFFIFGKDIYEWYALDKGVDALIDHKRPFLNIAFILATGVLLIAIWSFFGHLFKTGSLKEDAEGGLANYKKGIRLSAMFMPLFGLGFSLFTFMWLMSIDAHWFSTIYGVYCFAGLFVTGMTVTMFISTHLKEGGFLPRLTGDHVHDMGKFMFAFSVFWAYIWVSQYLLIWYANIPEETFYYYQRLENYQLLFALNVVVNFLFPFIALMTRNAKREFASIRSVGRVMLVGRFLDIYLLIAPGVLGAAGGFSTMLMMFGAVLLMGGIFLFVVFKGFEGAPLETTKHPYFDESLHHDTGV